MRWRCRGCGVTPLRCSGSGKSHGGGRGPGARRGAGGKWLSGACPDVRGERLVAAFSRRHNRGVRAPLGLEVAEATPEVGVFAVEGGRPRLQWLHGEGMFFLGHRECTGVRFLTCWIVSVRSRSCESEAGLHVLKGNGVNPCSGGGLHAGPDRLKAPPVGGGSARVTQKGPRRHRVVRA